MLYVKEIVALANSGGGYLLLGVENNKEITGCTNYDLQNIIESVYDRTMHNLFTRAKVVELQGKDVIVITVDKSNRLCGISSGKYYKRLGKNSKPYTPDRMEETFDEENDYSSRVINQSCVDDINLLEVYKLKEKLKRVTYSRHWSI